MGALDVPADDPAGARRLRPHDGGDLHRFLRRLRGDLPLVLGRRPARVPAHLPGLRLDHRRRPPHREQSRHPGCALRDDARVERAVPLHPYRACDARLGGGAREEPAGRHPGRDHADARLGARRDGRLHRGGADRAEPVPLAADDGVGGDLRARGRDARRMGFASRRDRRRAGGRRRREPVRDFHRLHRQRAEGRRAVRRSWRSSCSRGRRACSAQRR